MNTYHFQEWSICWLKCVCMCVCVYVCVCVCVCRSKFWAFVAERWLHTWHSWLQRTSPTLYPPHGSFLIWACVHVHMLCCRSRKYWSQYHHKHSHFTHILGTVGCIETMSYMFVTIYRLKHYFSLCCIHTCMSLDSCPRKVEGLCIILRIYVYVCGFGEQLWSLRVFIALHIILRYSWVMLPPSGRITCAHVLSSSTHQWHSVNISLSLKCFPAYSWCCDIIHRVTPMSTQGMHASHLFPTWHACIHTYICVS